ncbi:hypothetical protein BH11PSE2_BH11PSE2_13930 [soil metagenome]
MRPMVIAVVLLSLAMLGLAGALAWYGMAWRTGWFSGPPRIADDVWPIAGSVSPSWIRRLRDRYPIGSSEIALAEDLKRQGFDIDLAGKRAGYGWAKYPCVYTLTVSWRADPPGRVRAVQGGLLDACTDVRKLAPERPPRFRPPAPLPAADPALVPRNQSA